MVFSHGTRWRSFTKKCTACTKTCAKKKTPFYATGKCTECLFFLKGFNSQESPLVHKIILSKSSTYVQPSVCVCASAFAACHESRYGLPGIGPKGKQQGGGLVGPGVSFGGMSSFSEGPSNASSSGVDASHLGGEAHSVGVGGDESPAAVAALADKYREQVWVKFSHILWWVYDGADLNSADVLILLLGPRVACRASAARRAHCSRCPVLSSGATGHRRNGGHRRRVRKLEDGAGEPPEPQAMARSQGGSECERV